MGIVTSMTAGVSEREANDALNAYVSAAPRPRRPLCFSETLGHAQQGGRLTQLKIGGRSRDLASHASPPPLSLWASSLRA